LVSALSSDSSVLEWYSSQAAFDCLEMELKIFTDLSQVIQQLGIVGVDIDAIQNNNEVEAVKLIDSIYAHFDSIQERSKVYTITSYILKPMIRWMVSYVRYNLKESMNKKCMSELKEIQSEIRTSVP